MTTQESAIHNRISTKCHLFVKTYYPSEYKKLVAAANEEYNSRTYRRNSLHDLQKALNPPPIDYPAEPFNPASYEEEEG